MLNFYELETRYGSPVAYHLLQEIEQVACIHSWSVSAVDPEARLANALRAQDAVHASDICIAA